MSDPVLDALNRTAEEGYAPGELDLVIARIRKHRQDFERGIKPKKEPSGELEKLMKNAPKPKALEGFKRRT